MNCERMTQMSLVFTIKMPSVSLMLPSSLSSAWIRFVLSKWKEVGWMQLCICVCVHLGESTSPRMWKGLQHN